MVEFFYSTKVNEGLYLSHFNHSLVMQIMCHSGNSLLYVMAKDD